MMDAEKIKALLKRRKEIITRKSEIENAISEVIKGGLKEYEIQSSVSETKSVYLTLPELEKTLLRVKKELSEVNKKIAGEDGMNVVRIK